MTLSAYSVTFVVAVLLVTSARPLDSRQSAPGATTPAQDRRVEEVLRLMAGPGVYVDAGEGPLVALKDQLPDGVDYKKTSTPQPVFLRVRGLRAAVRTGPRPSIYFRNVESVRVGTPGAYKFSATLHAAQAQKELRLVEWGTFSFDRSRGMSVKGGAATIEVVIDAISDDVYRLRPAAPLAPGEFVIVPARVSAETAVSFAIDPPRFKATTGLYEFGVDAK
jgi:hypothetical protein